MVRFFFALVYLYQSTFMSSKSTKCHTGLFGAIFFYQSMVTNLFEESGELTENFSSGFLTQKYQKLVTSNKQTESLGSKIAQQN